MAAPVRKGCWPERSPRLAVALVLVSVTVPFIGFAAFLDRYPPFYVDEPFYNYPAISHLNGNGYIYPHGVNAPHKDLVWAYNGPFFSRVQAVTFAVFGSNLRTWRLPELVAWFVAVALISLELVRRDHLLAGATLALLSAGDRSLQEVLLGRPDGIALLLLACAWWFILRATESGSGRAAIGAGLCLGTACGFHFTAGPFVVAAYAALIALTKAERRFGVLVGLTAGGLVPLTAVVCCWAPHIPEALEQLGWHIRLPMPGPYEIRVRRLFGSFGWSSGWVLALLAGWGASCVRLMVESRRGRSPTEGLSGRGTRPLQMTACLFGAAGLATLFAPRALYPYYLVYFSVWSLLALLTWAIPRREPPNRRWARVSIMAAVFATWVPSLAWNTTRLREAVVLAGPLDHAAMVARLRAAVPIGAEVTVEPDLLEPAVEAGLVVTPLPYAGGSIVPPADAYLLLSARDLVAHYHVHADGLVGRAILFQGPLFPGAGQFEHPVVVLSPVR